MALPSGSFNSSQSQYSSYFNYYTVNWASSSSSNQYTITIKVKLAGDIGATLRECTNTTLTITAVSGCTVTPASRATGVNGSIYVNQYIPNNKNESEATTYTFTVTQSGTSNPKIKLGISGTIGSTSVSGTSNTIELPALTTACGAPSSVTASGYVAPNGSFTLSWNGATAGVGNAISGYTVYWRVTSGGSAPTTNTYTGTHDVTSTATSGTYKVTLSNATRGYKVVCGVVTKGAAGLNSSIKTGGLVLVNHLPTAPQLDDSTAGTITKTIKAYQDSASVVPTRGTDTDGHTVYVRYALASVGTPTADNTTQCTSESTLSLSLLSTDTTKTWRFWSYDGYEFSENYKSFTITRDTACTTEYTATPTYYTAKGSSDVYVKSISLDMTWTNLRTGSSNESTYIICYTTDGSNPTWGNSASTKYVQASPTSVTGSGTETTTRTLTLNSRTWLINAGISTNNDIRFRVYMRVNNSYGDSSLYSNETAYKIAGAPTTDILTYNQFANANITGTTTGHFYNKVRIKYPRNTLLTTSSFVATSGSGNNIVTYSISSSVSNSGSTTTADITFIDIPASTTVVTIKAIQSLDTITRDFTVSMTEVKAPTIGTLTFMNPSAGYISPFTGTDTSLISTGWPFGTDSLSDAIGNFELGSTDNIQIEITCNNISIGKNFTWTKENDTLKTTYSESSIYDLTNNDCNLQYNGSYPFTAKFKITNLYGGVYYSANDSRAHSFNFDVNPTSVTIGTITYTGTEISGNLESNKIQEGLTLSFPTTAAVYTKGSYTFALQSKIGSGSWSSNLVTKTITSNGATSRTTVNVSTTLTYAIGEITSDSQITWRVVVSNGSLTNNGTTSTYNVVQQTAPTITLTQCTITNNNFNYKYTESSTGSSSFATIERYLSDGSTEFTNALTTDDGTIAIKTGVTVPEIVNVSIKIKSTIQADPTNGILLTSEKIYYSNYILVYQITPTVAYRKNQLGINTSEPDSTAVLDIRGQTGKNIIKIVGIDGNMNNIIWTLSLDTGEIAVSNGVTNYSISLLNGTLN